VKMLLRIWLLATAAVLAGMALWAFAPMLLFMGLLTAALGAASALMVAFARALRAARERRADR
jgi:hypothetical protein